MPWCVYKTKEASELKCDAFFKISDRFVWNRNVNFVAIDLRRLGRSQASIKENACKSSQHNNNNKAHWWHLIGASNEQHQTIVKHQQKSVLFWFFRMWLMVWWIDDASRKKYHWSIGSTLNQIAVCLCVVGNKIGSAATWATVLWLWCHCEKSHCNITNSSIVHAAFIEIEQ